MNQSRVRTKFVKLSSSESNERDVRVKRWYENLITRLDTNLLDQSRTTSIKRNTISNVVTLFESRRTGDTNRECRTEVVLVCNTDTNFKEVVRFVEKNWFNNTLSQSCFNRCQSTYLSKSSSRCSKADCSRESRGVSNTRCTISIREVATSYIECRTSSKTLRDDLRQRGVEITYTGEYNISKSKISSNFKLNCSESTRDCLTVDGNECTRCKSDTKSLQQSSTIQRCSNCRCLNTRCITQCGKRNDTSRIVRNIRSECRTISIRQMSNTSIVCCKTC